MPATGHPTPADLQAFVVGTLPDPAASVVESHLSDCPACQQAAAAAADDTLVSLLRSVETSQAGPVTPGTAFNETVGLSRPGAEAAPGDCPPGLTDHPKYRLVRPLGRGGMGHVWLAEHTVMGRPVALKVVRPEYLDRPEAVERFRREVRLAARLSHPNIVAAHDAEQASGTHFLVMEYIDGETLAERVETGPASAEDACRWTIDAARGLEHARLQGLFHRDVKPHNLIRERVTGRVKVLDFGLAGVIAGEASGLTGGNMVIGTPDYIAPEQAMDARKADTRSDVYALGCTLYHLLAGRPPFAGDSVLAKIDAHRHDRPEPLTAVRQDMTPALAELVARMMAKDPKDRPQTPGEVATALEELLAGRGGDPPMPNRRWRDEGASERGRRWLLKRVGLIAVIAIGLLVGAKVVQSKRMGMLTVRTEESYVDAVVHVVQDGKVVRSFKVPDSVQLPNGTYDLELKAAAGLRLSTDRVDVESGRPLIILVEKDADASPADLAPFLLRGTPNAPFTDLMAFVDPSRDREAGSLGSHSRAYLTVASDKAGPARVALQARPDGNYEFRARIARVSGDGSFNLMLPVPGTDGKVQVGALVDGVRDRDGRTRLDWPGGPDVHMVKSFGDRLQPGRQYLVLGRVTRAADRFQVDVTVDGTKVIEWSGPATQDRNGTTAFTADRRQLGFGASDAQFRIDRLELRMLNGSADLSRQPGPAPADSAGPSLWADLIDGLKLPTVILDGTWGWSGGFGDKALIGGNPKAGKSGRLAFPVWPRTDYELRIRFQRIAGSDCLTVMLPIPGAPGVQTALVVDGYAAQGGFIGLEYVNKKPDGRPMSEVNGGRLTNKLTHTLHVRVTHADGRASVQADLDDKPAQQWAGPVGDLTPSLNWFTPDRNQIGLGVWDDCQFRFEAVEYRRFTGSQAVATPAPKPMIRQFARFKGNVHQLALAPSGTYAFAADDQVARWNVETGDVQWVADQPGGSILALSGDAKVLTVWAQDGTARVLDPTSGKELRRLPIPNLPVRNAVLNRDGTRAFVSQRGNDKGARSVVAAWNVTTGKEDFRLSGIAAETYGLALSPDDAVLATAGYDKRIVLWNAAAGTPLHTFPEQAAELSCVSFSADGKHLVTGGGDNQLRVWSIEQKQCVSLLTGHTTWVLSAAFSPDGTRIVSGAGYDGKGDGVRVWNWRTGEQLAHFTEAKGMVGSVAATRDKLNAVTAEDNGQIRVWRLPQPPSPPAPDFVGPVRRFGRFGGGISGVSLSKDGRHLYAMEEGLAVVKWDRTAGAVVWTHDLPKVGGFQVAATADERHVVVGCTDGTARVLDAATGRELRRFTKHSERVLGVTVSPDGKRAATTSGTKDPMLKFSIRVWEIETANELFELKGTEDESWAIRLSPDGLHLATASDDGKVRLWDATTGALEHTFTGHRGMASGVAFSPDGRRLASSGQDLTVRLWDVEKRAPLRVLEGHTVWVSDLAFTPDGTRLLSVGSNWIEDASDGLRVWDAADGKPLYRGAAQRTEDVGLAVTPDGRFALTGGMTGAIWEWRLPPAPVR